MWFHVQIVADEQGEELGLTSGSAGGVPSLSWVCEWILGRIWE